MPTTAIWWIRRDLRLTDNQALHLACTLAQQVLPVFIIDPGLQGSQYNSPKRASFLWGGLQALQQELQKIGSNLVVRTGAPAEVLGQLCLDNGAVAVCAERDYSPYAVARDGRVAQRLGDHLHLTPGVSIREPATVLKDDGRPYTVFTPFSRRWQAPGPIRRSVVIPAPHTLTTPQGIASEPTPAPTVVAPLARFPPGEPAAKQRLATFVNGETAPVFDYANQRNLPGIDGTSQLSPYLRFGMISPRLTALAAYEAIARAPTAESRRGAEVWLSEIIWREFYIQILHHFPYVRSSCFRPIYDGVAWANNPVDFAAWCEGRTGYPIVDAAMRQLAQTGWMHNRTRMIAASFLVKDLLIDWRWGERWFMQHLLDGDPAANNGGWQWTAGTGTDAAPYFRVFNPVSQGQRFDPQGAYIRRWLPELAAVDERDIHEPWLMPRSDQIRAHCQIGQDYPAPITDHAFSRQRVLAAYKAAGAEIAE
ncbi:MAG: deoxyribodipyrimidine photo-lyase [Anaerolineales bacterium]|nr:deoxyribodipyrimidine photo-lyase [Anaerolineales bacterium]